MPVHSFSEAEIALKARRRLELPLFVTIWMGAACFSFAEGRVFYLAAITLAVAVNLSAAYRTRELHISRPLINTAMALCTLVLLLEALPGRAPLPAAVAHYMILIQSVKLFERKKNRDYVQMLAMSMLCVVAAGLFSQAPWFAAALGVYLVGAIHTTMVLTLKRGLDASVEARLVTESGPLDVKWVAWNVIRDWPTGAMARRLGGILTVVILAGIGMFLVAPRERTSSPLEALGVGSSGTTGYTSNVTLGEARKIFSSDRVLMWISLAGNGGRSVEYLRGEVFDTYDRSRWNKRATVVRPDAQWPALPPEMLQGALVQHVSIAQVGLLPILFAVFPAVKVECPDGTVRVEPGMQMALEAPVFPNRPVRYTAYSWPRPLTEQQRAYLAEVEGVFRSSSRRPEQTVRVPQAVAELARSWCEDLLQTRQADPSRQSEFDLAIAQRIAQHLREGYGYTLDLSRADPDRDGVEDFLFYMKQGHCEYFASAMTVMCRLLGVNARLATGFLVEEYNPVDGHYVVRERDAHAWTEVFTPASDWVIFDATSSSRTAMGGQGWRRSADNFWVAMRYLWYRHVIGYDVDAQRRLWQRLADAVLSAWAALRDSVGQSATNLLVHGYVDAVLIRLTAATGAVALVLEVLLCVRFCRRGWRARAARRELSTRPWGALPFIPQLWKLLERKGLSRQAHQTPRELAAEAAERFRLPPELLLDLVELYYQARWGHVVPPAGQIAAAEAQVGRIRRILSA